MWLYVHWWRTFALMAFFSETAGDFKLVLEHKLGSGFVSLKMRFHHVLCLLKFSWYYCRDTEEALTGHICSSNSVHSHEVWSTGPFSKISEIIVIPVIQFSTLYLLARDAQQKGLGFWEVHWDLKIFAVESSGLTYHHQKCSCYGVFLFACLFGVLFGFFSSVLVIAFFFKTIFIVCLKS